MNNRSASTGISTLSLLGVAFIVLKLLGKIGWSWWWVTAPFWGPLALGVVIAVLMILWAICKGVTIGIKRSKGR